MLSRSAFLLQLTLILSLAAMSSHQAFAGWFSDGDSVGDQYSSSEWSSPTTPTYSDLNCCADPCNEPWHLFPQCGRWKCYGWLDGGATANADHAPSKFNGPLTFNDYSSPGLNQFYAVLERPLDTQGVGWDWGGRADVLWGTDYLFTEATGLETHQSNIPLLNNAPHWNQRRFYGVALPQFYAEAAYCDWSLKAGHFYTPIGYETVQAISNFFYSHAYTHRYGQPITHTGALLTHQWNDQLSVAAGAINGADGFDRIHDQLGGIAGFTYRPCSGCWSLAAYGMSSSERNFNLTTSPQQMYSVVFTYNFTERFQWVLEHDYGWQKRFFGDQSNAQWYSASNYLYYNFNDKWKGGFRAEWFRDDDGSRVNGFRQGNPATGPFIGNFFDITVGLNWQASKNLRLRPELRWDWFDGTGTPYNDSTKTYQLTSAFDIIFQW